MARRKLIKDDRLALGIWVFLTIPTPLKDDPEKELLGRITSIDHTRVVLETYRHEGGLGLVSIGSAFRLRKDNATNSLYELNIVEQLLIKEFEKSK